MGCALPLAEHGVGPRQILLRLAQPRGVLGHPHRELEPEIENLLGQLPRLLLELVLGELTPLRRFHRPVSGPYSALVRDTNFVVMPIFWAAVRNASRATSSGTPIIS